MNDTMVPQSFDTRCQRVLQVAKQLYQSNPDWVTFFREVLGVEGAARTVFPDQNDYIAFEKSDCYSDVQQMVTSLRTRKIPGPGSNEPTRVITVRLPESLHEALKAEADDHNTSMNKLCISKLLQVLIIDESQPAPPKRNTMPSTAVAPAISRGMAQPQSPSPAPVPQGAIGSYSNL